MEKEKEPPGALGSFERTGGYTTRVRIYYICDGTTISFFLPTKKFFPNEPFFLQIIAFPRVFTLISIDSVLIIIHL